jgi:predicted HicB family RNase H-like nuclease
MFVVKNSPEMVSKTFRLSSDLVNKLDEVAKSQGVSMNNLVQQCCEYALSDLPSGMNQQRKKES